MYNLFFRGKSLSVGTREGFLACGDVTSQTSTYLFLRQNYQKGRHLNTSCRYNCMLAFSSVTRKLTSISRNSRNKLWEFNQKYVLSTRSLTFSGTGHCKEVTVITSSLYNKGGAVQAGSIKPHCQPCFRCVYSPSEPPTQSNTPTDP